MAGTWVFNLFFAFFGFALVFVSSFAQNSFFTSVYRGFFASIFFFLIAYFFRWMVYFILLEPQSNADKHDDSDVELDSETNENLRENEHVYQAPEALSDDEAKLASQYIKELLNEKD
ncbi:hypothetical protein ACFSCX_04595 [Bacillus salitolerans]|uniref:Uncharacterized protein n=1 Tax=Bacillus salitolerans TaxID=1437434 RepID=A0ABW4LKW4_9BACI